MISGKVLVLINSANILPDESTINIDSINVHHIRLTIAMRIAFSLPIKGINNSVIKTSLTPKPTGIKKAKNPATQEAEKICIEGKKPILI